MRRWFITLVNLGGYVRLADFYIHTLYSWGMSSLETNTYQT
jgi:hypothetical protein